MDLKISWNELPEEDLGDVRRRIFTGKNVMVVRNIIKPRAVLSAHTHPHEQISYVVSGEILFRLDGEEHRMKKGDSVYIPGSVPHCLRALTDAVVLDVFTPERKDFLK